MVVCSCVRPVREQLLGFHSSEQVEERFGELRDQLRDGVLTCEERDEFSTRCARSSDSKRANAASPA
jgi:hypothetical protein